MQKILILQNTSNVSEMEVNDSKTKETEKVELSSMEFVNELEDLEQQFIKKLLLLKKKETRQKREIR